MFKNLERIIYIYLNILLVWVEFFFLDNGIIVKIMIYVSVRKMKKKKRFWINYIFFLFLQLFLL